MDLNIAIKQFRAYGQELKTALAKCKRAGKVHKTAAYKKRRTAELTKLWDNIKDICTQIDAALIEADPCYEKEKADLKLVYTEYSAELAKISGTSSGAPTDEEVALHIRKQDTRFEALGRTIEDVIEKQVTNSVVTTAYCKTKLKAILEYWSRIQIEDENYELDRALLSAEYNEKMVDYESLVEEAEMFLYEQMEKPDEIRKDGIKVQRVTVPKFHGDYFKWVSFRDLFTSLVLNNKALSDAERMQILKTNLGGEAETLIADLTISNVNFNCAWDRLIGRYDNNRVVVYKHLNKLMTQQLSKTDSKSMKKLLDTTDQILLALTNLGRPTAQWDDWIVLVIIQKFSDECRKDWEKKIGNTTNLPTWQELKLFMEEEFRMLEGLENVHKKAETKKTDDKNDNSKGFGVVKAYQASVDKKGCPACEGEHNLFACQKFKELEPKERWDLAKKRKLCFLCLKVHKDKLKCERKKPCKRCTRQHSTWLHEDRTEETVTNAHGTVEGQELTNAHGSVMTQKQVLLATTIITTRDEYGRKIFLRALVDSGSQGSMITEAAAASLQLKPVVSNKWISGLGENRTGRAKMVNLKIMPRFESEVQLTIDCYLLRKLTKPLPDRELCIKTWHHLKGLTLADPTFNKVGPIDVLLGTDVVGEIMQPGLIKGTNGKPMAQQTTFGWIVSGTIDPKYPKNEIKCLVSTQEEDIRNLHKFWELEELNPKRTMTSDEQSCEEFYQNTYKRDMDGKFTVKIPVKEGNLGLERLGASKGQSMARFLQLEKRFQKDEKLKTDYVKVMREYIDLGHMKDVQDEPDSNKRYYIPHHAVIKPDSLTTKTRVVFDASAKTSTGWSLNDCMFTGAKQQNDLMETLIKWRKHKIVFKADIEKMYRMIKLDKEDQKYHTVLWREKNSEPIREYQLTTVTFGTAAAPFLATRTLNQIALDSKNQYPKAAEILKEDFYVDDLISGSDSISEANKCKTEVIEALMKGGLNLRKWTSNSQELLDSLPDAMTERSLQTFTDEDVTKALGLQWNPKSDKFNFKISWEMKEGKITKRQLLSEASKLFDPLGWLAPTIINAKLLMQKVWLSKIGWDEEVSPEIKEKWIQFRNELQSLAKITVDRWIQYEPGHSIELHGFCDASEKAYGAVVYTRITKGDKVVIRLIISKTRVAPIHLKTTLPRLELCGAVLLANLLKSVKESLKLETATITAWSDSMITLGWLKGEPHKWKTFVANRVSDIQSTRINDWRYIKSEENPADCISRGLMPGELQHHPLWWTGPEWLKTTPENWPSMEIIGEEIEMRNIAVNIARVERTDLLLNGSSWFKTVRVMAYILRMKKRVKTGTALTLSELEAAKTVLYKLCQQEGFPVEISNLRNKEPISSKSRLLQLHPFLDENGIMRVGGRLQNAVISFNNKHPIILPSEHETTKLLVHQMHLDTLHGGPQLMVGLLRKRYWIINAKRIANKEFQQCVNCKRFQGHTKEQLMGNLPKDRVTLDRAFLHTGIDYAGPIEIRTSRLRNAKILKGYIAIFVCFGTKAVHLELVSDMTTVAFLAALNRFMARRGLCNTIYSDNGSNFVGAANALQVQEKGWLNQQNKELAMLLVNKGINWKFIPPGSPNFGGLWERGVRSMKDHLKRTLKNSRLTFEEYGTILCQIEACLNSRPLCPLTTDSENLNALTPGHFLIGDALMAPPQPILLDNQANKLHRWRHLQLLQQHFWNRWHKEYLNQLQQRQKWKSTQENVNIGDLVLLKDEQVSPRNWLMGRIIEVHPGTDGKIRVVTLRTQKGEIKRPITKICILTTMDNNVIEHQDPVDSSQSRFREIDEHDLGPDINPEHRNRVENPIISKDNLLRMPNTKYNLRTRNSLKVPQKFKMMIVIFGLMLILGGGSAINNDAIKVTKFENKAGIYYEDLGRATIIRTKWHMYIRFGLDKYLYEFKRLQEVTQLLTELCIGFDSDMTDSHCADITRLLSQNVAEIKSLNILLKTNGDEMNKKHILRHKRAAPLNFIGWIQHELFGVMAADQADYMETQFELVAQDSNHLMNLIKNQTSVVENTVNLIKTSHMEINTNYGKITETINSLANETNKAKKKIKLMGLALFTSIIVNQFEKTQRNILDMLTDVHEGHISSYIFTPQQFQEQLEIINNNLPIGSRLPESAQHDFKSLYKLIKGRARVTERSILVDIMIPLVTTTEYQVLHVIPIPIEHQGDQITIQPESEYLVITLKKDNFYQLNEKDINTCLKPHKRLFICSLGQPLYNARSRKGQCERDLLVQTTILSNLCKFNRTKERDYWIQLHEKNRWIYGLKNKLTLNLVCDSDIQSFTLEGTGILEIPAGCEVTQLGMSLIAETIKQSDGKFNFYPSLNLSEAVIKLGHVTNIKMSNLTLDHNEQINEIQKQLKDLDQQSTFNTVHHNLHYGGYLGLWTILGLIGILIWWKRHDAIKLISKWMSMTATNDVEGEGRQLDNIIHHTNSGDTNQQVDKVAVINHHNVGECPFRT